MGTTLLADATNTRTAIMKHQKTALLGLQILTELLAAPVRDHIWYCSNIIFTPHEILHSVAFCALHNKETFLIQEKTIASSHLFELCISALSSNKHLRLLAGVRQWGWPL